MSCQELETTINELARGQMTDATSRDKAFSHAASCAQCAMQLEDQRTLSAGLRRLAAVAAEEQAPSRVEASLLTAFREQRAALAPVPSRAAIRRWIYVGAGVAAAVAIVMLLSLTASRTREMPQQTPQASENPGLSSQPAPAQPAVQPPASDKIQRKKPATNLVPQPQQANGRTNAPSDKGKRRANDTDQPAETEIATDFFPLMNRESLPQLDGGQVVRVELPRSALMSFGLPMNMDRANERIKADVVVGNDGLARAIRFVR